MLPSNCIWCTRGFVVLREPLIVHDLFASTHGSVFLGGYCVCLKAEDCTALLDCCGPAGMQWSGSKKYRKSD